MGQTAPIGEVKTDDHIKCVAAKVLVAEDDEFVRRTIRIALEKADFEVSYARDGAEAWDLARKLRPDVIISDIMMPKMNGLEFCKRVKEDKELSQAYFIFLTAQGGADSVSTGLGEGADDYIPKPFQVKELIARVSAGKRMLDQRREMKQMEAQLAQSEKFGSITMLGASMAHEINSPLGAVIQNHATLSKVLARFPDSELKGLACEIVEDNQVALRRLKIITSGLRKLHRSGCSTALINVDVNEEIEFALSMLAHRCGGRVTIECDFSDSLPEVSMPEGELGQVVVNLIGNALDAVDGEGTITIRTDQQGEHVRIRVQDSGEGIPESVLPRIFDPFYTTKPAGQGTGLGLSLCRDILEKRGGRISVQSGSNQPTTFTIELQVRASCDKASNTDR